jgi:hypothetical protein
MFFFKKTVKNKCQELEREKIKSDCSPPRLGEIGNCEIRFTENMEYESYGVSSSKFKVEKFLQAKSSLEDELKNIALIKAKIEKDEKEILSTLCVSSEFCSTKIKA